MSTIRIDGVDVAADDPCALYQALYAVKIRMMVPGSAEELEIRSPVTNRRVAFSRGNLAALEQELRLLADACDAKQGRRKRFSVTLGC